LISLIEHEEIVAHYTIFAWIGVFKGTHRCWETPLSIAYVFAFLARVITKDEMTSPHLTSRRAHVGGVDEQIQTFSEVEMGIQSVVGLVVKIGFSEN
jgi:hypothetical protein